MSDPSREELEAILREQAELRLRLVALDRKIAELPRLAPAASVTPVLEKMPEPIRNVPAAVPQPEVSEWSAPLNLPPPLPTWLPAKKNVPLADQPLPEVEQETPVFAGEKIEPRPSFEFRLGTVWLVRIGIVVLLTGLVLLGNYAYQNIVPRLGPELKILGLALISGLLATLGLRLARSGEALRNYGRVLLAGGAALFYYTTFAASFVESLRVIPQPLVGGLILLIVGGAIVWWAARKKAQSVVLMAILLSYYTSAINPIGWFSLYSNLLLTATGVWFLARERWLAVGFLSLIGTYGSYAFWRLHGPVPESWWLGAAFLLGYWILFTAAVFLSRAKDFPPHRRVPFLTFNNGAFFVLALLHLRGWQSDSLGQFAMGFGAILLGLAWFSRTREKDDLYLDGAYLVQGLGIFTLGVLTELSGFQLVLALAVQGTILLCLAGPRHGWVHRLAAGIALFLAFALSLGKEGFGVNDALVRWSLAGVFLVDVWLVRHFRKSEPQPEWSWVALGYSLLAVTHLAITVDRTVPPESLGLVYCGGALLLVLLGTGLRLPELAVAGQLPAVFSVLAFFGQTSIAKESVGSLVAHVVTPLALTHWWQRWAPRGWCVGGGLFSALFVVAASKVLHGFAPAEWFPLTLVALSVGSLVYGVATRTWVTALLGQLVVFCAAWILLFEGFWESTSWLAPTAAVALVGGNLGLLFAVEKRFEEGIRVWFVWTRAVLAGVFFGLIMFWSQAYVESVARPLFAMAVAALLVHLGLRLGAERARKFLIYAFLAAIWGVLLFWAGFLKGENSSWWHVLALLLLAYKVWLVKRTFPDSKIIFWVSNGLILVVGSGLWLEMNRWLGGSKIDFSRTLAWALLATVFLAVGLAMRERVYRLGGLTLLGWATLRIFYHDIWAMGQLSRILTSIGVGVVILGLGYIYNKFADKFREWL